MPEFLIKTYLDLTEEIVFTRERIKDYEQEKHNMAKLAKADGPPKNLQAIDYGSSRVTSSGQIDFIYYIDCCKKINNHITLHQSHLEFLEKQQEKYKKLFERLEGVRYKIAWGRYAEGKTLEKIGEEVGYAHNRIAEILKELDCKLYKNFRVKNIKKD